MIKFNLQMFNGGGEPTPEPEPRSEDPKTLTQEEVNKQIASVVAKERAKADAIAKNQNEAITLAVNDALEKQKKLSELDDNGKKDLELQEERTKREALELQIKATEIKSDALNIFQERNLPTKLLEFVLSATSEATLERINELETAFNETVQAEVKNLVKGKAPLVGTDTETNTNTFSVKDMASKRIVL